MTKIAFTDAAFPPLLKEIPHPPRRLYIEGTLPEPSKICVAIVGTRKATAEGRRIARQFAEELSRAGIIIVSGLAMGIDTAAHEGALGGGGHTVAVLPTALTDIYPRQNQGLAKKIIEKGGAVLTEYSAGEESYLSNFIARNRIVSGLSRAVVVVEAPVVSGAKATVRFALDQNREVCVVPGPITHPNYRGSNDLIKEGAHLVTTADDVLSILGIEPGRAKENESKNTLFTDLSVDQKEIIRIVRESAHGASIEEICLKSRLNPAAAASAAAYLVIRDVLAESGGRYILRT